MPKITYIDRTFNQPYLEVIFEANKIIREYQERGFDLTLRQLYYQFVARGLLPNQDREYKRLVKIISQARMAGLVDWAALVDRTRFLRTIAHWDEPKDLLWDASRQYRIDKWADQDVRIEVWIEKDALVGVIEQVCEENDVPYFSCRGYTSQSALWGAAQRIRGRMFRGSKAVIIHLADHDPSGIDMTRDIEDRLRTFVSSGKLLASMEIRRIALTMDQVEQYSPPPNPAKITDSRCSGYMAQYGQDSWELDALDPATISSLISETIDEYRDQPRWAASVRREEREADQIALVSRRWDDVIRFLRKRRERF